MNPESKLPISEEQNFEKFVQSQKNRIIERLKRYNNKEEVRTQIIEIGDLTPYQKYKIYIISPILIKALEVIESGKYGICLSCGCNIPKERLLLVPATLKCVGCENPLR